ncbi:hypothetical protein [Oscillibacter sp.]|uniref:hypothetical protein n=1 Tax=Oscillibacter sp. TaxID=1945593 RepID=UPI0026242391|nr:hypothetical protein [Oscillibacter sp.]
MASVVFRRHACPSGVRREALEALLRHEGQQLWYSQLMTTPQTIADFCSRTTGCKPTRCA